MRLLHYLIRHFRRSKTWTVVVVVVVVMRQMVIASLSARLANAIAAAKVDDRILTPLALTF